MRHVYMPFAAVAQACSLRCVEPMRPPPLEQASSKQGKPLLVTIELNVGVRESVHHGDMVHQSSWGMTHPSRLE